MGPGILEAGGEFDPLESPPSIDLFPDYMVTVIVPLVIAIVLCLLLAYIMFGRREGVYAFISLLTAVSTTDAILKNTFYMHVLSVLYFFL